MSEVYSGTLGVVLMVTGTDNNTWGALCNTSVFQILEDAIANVLTEVLTGGTLDLSGMPPPAGPSQTRYAAITVSGVLGSNQIIQVPNLTKVWWIKNSTSGAFTLKFKTPSGSASIAIPQNSGWQTVSCDGANNITVSPFNSAQVQMPDGAVGAPAYSNVNEPTSGLYRVGAGSWAFSILGTNVFTLTATGIGFPGAAVNENRVTIASSATPAIGAAAANYILISGTTGITGFDTIAAGAERTLEFQGILTLTNSGTLILQGAGDIKTAAGDVAKFRSEGAGTWRCVSYMRALAPPPPSLAAPFEGQGPVNFSLAASSNGTLLTVALKDQAGNDPSVASPVWIPFPDTAAASGLPQWAKVTGALSINTNAAGATLATQNGKPFRLWVVAFNNGGTPVLALWHSGSGAAAIAINPLNEGVPQTTVAISAAAASAGVFYTPNGTTLVGKTFRILGYVEYTSGVATAGTYSAPPDIVQLFGPGIKKPGDVVQSVYFTTSTQSGGTASAYTSTNITQNISPTSPSNLVSAKVSTPALNNNYGVTTARYSLFRGATQIGSEGVFVLNGVASSSTVQFPLSLAAFDNPQTTASTTYVVKIASSDGVTAVAVNSGNRQGIMVLDEIMG